LGKDAGIKYSNYYEHYQQLLPMVEDIYNGKDVSNRYNHFGANQEVGRLHDYLCPDWQRR